MGTFAVGNSTSFDWSFVLDFSNPQPSNVSFSSLALSCFSVRKRLQNSHFITSQAAYLCNDNAAAFRISLSLLAVCFVFQSRGLNKK